MIQDLTFFINEKIKSQVKDNDYLNLMMLVSKIYLRSKIKNDEKDDDVFESYNEEYIEDYI